MNSKITKEEHERLNGGLVEKLLFGSRLFGTHNDKSDYDYVCLYDFEKVFGYSYKEFSEYKNIHSFQYDDKENNTQYVWMTYEQFKTILVSGDGTINADIILIDDSFGDSNEKLKLCRSQKIIKAYCGVAKRDMKLHPNNPKKRFHALKSIYIANKLMDNKIPLKEDIKDIHDTIMTYSVGVINRMITDARERCNKLLTDGEIKPYNFECFVFNEPDDLLNKFLELNNQLEFRY